MNDILSMLAAGTGEAPRGYSEEMERRARANGFRSAEEMMAWANQRNQQSGGTVSEGRKDPSIDAAMAWHPRNIFNYISSRWGEALKGN